MKIATIQFPGSNCERETALAIERAGMEAVPFLWNEPLEKLDTMDGYVIVGGFSYEDRSRAGIIAALDPVMKCLRKAAEQGKPILGICNGAQILVESGLVPGCSEYRPALALTENRRISGAKVLGTGFYNNWVHLCSRKTQQNNAFTRFLTPGQPFYIPSAHAEGRFLLSEALLKEVQQRGLDCLLYCDEQGEVRSDYPVNPNGSIANIAAISNAGGNVMAMMPHPERCLAGDCIFQSMRSYIEEGDYQACQTLHYQPASIELKPYSLPQGSRELLVELMITDNHAMSVQNSLRQMGLSLKVKRYIHWELLAKSTPFDEQWLTTGLLYNDRKERCLTRSELSQPEEKSLAILVRSHDNIKGMEALQHLEDHFDIKDFESIKQGIVWMFSGKEDSLNLQLNQILDSRLIANPYAHECFYYDLSSN